MTWVVWCPSFFRPSTISAGTPSSSWIDILVMQSARHIDRFLHVAAIIEDVGQHMDLADRLILSAHHAKGITARPFLVTMDGMMVCSGLLPGAMQLGWPG